jgi:hypothetical protein
MPPATHDVMDALKGSLDNLALAATSDRNTVQQLTLANLSLTMAVATLTAAKKAHQNGRLLQPCASGTWRQQGMCWQRPPPWSQSNLGKLLLEHGYKVSPTSKTCNVIGRKPGHDEAAMVADTKGGVDFNKDWYLQGNRAPWQWGIAADIVSNNILLNQQKLAVTTLDSSNPTLHSTNNDSGIVNSGLLGFYFGPNYAPVNSYDATAPTIEVQVANSTLLQSIASDVMVSFSHILIGLIPFVDTDCQVLFTKTLVIAFNENGYAILIGWRETTSPQLWRWPLLPQQLMSPSLSVVPRQLTPCTHDTQLDTIHWLCNVIASVLVCPTTLSRQPTQHSACAALLECLGNTITTDATGAQNKIKFQYNTAAFMVMASSKGGRLPFDPR